MVVGAIATNEQKVTTTENMKNVVYMGEAKNSSTLRKEVVQAPRVVRVATLYRVSTKKQLNPSEHGGDIPTQRKACQDFIDSKSGWALVKEYTEKGVSGFKKKSSERDELQQILLDAGNNKFDVLLVFMFDRLGRLEDDTPFFIQALVNAGVEVWSVQEGQQKFDDHIDKLLNYIRSWQSNGESLKTSVRVNESHKQMVEEGIYRGGTVPFGYKTVPSGKFNKKGKELLKVVIDSEAADIVRLIYDLADQEGYGQYRIPRLLNEKGLRTNRGKPWSSPSVSALLRNPMYKGYMAYGRGTGKEVFSKEPNPELIIIDAAKWDRVQALRKGRNPENTNDPNVPKVLLSTKSTLLLIGMSRCGHCGHALGPTWNQKKWKRKDGSEGKNKSPKYRCSGKSAQKAITCAGQTTHSQKRLEGVVLDEVYRYLNHLKCEDINKKLEKLKNENVSDELKVLKALQKQLTKASKELSALEDEMMNVILGKSPLSREKISRMISDKEVEAAELSSKVEQVEHELNSRKVEREELEELQNRIPVWREVFERASCAKKKMMLNTIIDQIYVFKDKVEIHYKLRINNFIDAMGLEAVGSQINKKLMAHSTIASNA